jgi:hypothetical protein
LSETFVISEGRFDLVINAGSTWPNAFQDAEFLPTDNLGAPFSLTGWVAKLQVRESPDKPAVLDIEPTVDVTNNSVKFSFTAEETADLVLPNYVWACELQETSTGKVITLARGLVEVAPQIVME